IRHVILSKPSFITTFIDDAADRTNVALTSPSLFFFFFKQKTAYEIGLGIPAEPLFRSSTPQRQKLKFLPLRRYNLTLNLLSRSHDRRVGKECRSRWSPIHKKKKTNSIYDDEIRCNDVDRMCEYCI